MFVATYRAVPVAPYLGVAPVLLKGIGKRFKAFRQLLRPFDQLGIGARRQIDLAQLSEAAG